MKLATYSVSAIFSGNVYTDKTVQSSRLKPNNNNYLIMKAL